MRFEEIVLASRDVAGTSSRLKKIERLSSVLADLRPEEVPVAVAYLSGFLPQGSIGVGWASLKDPPAPADRPSLELLDVDAKLRRIGELAGAGSQAARRTALRELFSRATTGEQRFLRGLLTGEIRQGALEGVMADAVARAGELDDVAALFAPALEPYRGSGSDWIVDAYLAELEDVRPRFEEAEVVVAERDGRIVGTIAFYADVRLEGWSNLPAGWCGFRALAVHPRMRGAGIGEALVGRCVERGREVGAATLGIHTISLLTDAVRLYERVGFVRCPEFDLPAGEIFPSENADELVALAFRLELERGLEGRR